MNHKDDCTRESFFYSGNGYNRVKVCVCGAEDHAPDSFTQGLQVEKASRNAFLAFWFIYFSLFTFCCVLLYLLAEDYPLA